MNTYQSIMRTQCDRSTSIYRLSIAPSPRPLSASIYLPFLLCLAGLFLGLNNTCGTPDEANPAEVASHVRKLLYWLDADPQEKQNAAFVYKHACYTNDPVGISPQPASIAVFYTAAQRSRAAQAEAILLGGLAQNPGSIVLRDLLLDLYYDRTVADAILSREAAQKAERAHYGPKIAPPASGLFIIHNEIDAYAIALKSNRLALASYCTLLTNTLGVLDGDPVPLGYRIFQDRVPIRGLAPASYITNGVAISVNASSDPLFSGYRDLVLLYDLLSDQGRIASTLARLYFLRNDSGDMARAEQLTTETMRSLLLHAHLFKSAFPALNPNDPMLAHSGLSAAMANVSGTLGDLEQLRQLRRSQLNPLGFEPDFLVLMQDTFSGESAQNDTYSALLVHLGSSGSVLGQATNALQQARLNYAEYRGYEDQLAAQFANSSITYYDRLRDIVGYFPDDPLYATSIRGAAGSELEQQNLSIEAARLQIRKNQAEIANLNKQAAYELQKAAAISNVFVSYGNRQASITEWIGLINGVQAAANELANEAEAAGQLNLGGAAGHGVNALVQYAAEIGKGLLEAQKERLAALQNAEITGIEAETTIKILMLQMNTLAIDSLAATLQLRKDMNRLQDLYREKASLERKLKERDRDLVDRFFADPVHRLTLQAEMINADLTFAKAQKWLFYMVRALEYKWNECFISDSGWSLDTLFKLRNADELMRFYLEMKEFDNGKALYSVKDDRWDWLSLREDILGFRRFGSQGETLLYVDPVTGGNVDAITMFRRHLERHQDTNDLIQVEFDTVRQNHNTFFRGPDSVLQTPGQYLDKIDSMIIRLPGNHTTTNYSAWTTLGGALGYGGSSYLRNKFPGHPVEGRLDRLVNEMTAYSTRWGYVATNNVMRFREIRTNTVTMLKATPNVPRVEHDFPSDIPNRLATGGLIINTFRERSVATSRWILRIPTWFKDDRGNRIITLRIDDLDDIELYFYHWSYERP